MPIRKKGKHKRRADQTADRRRKKKAKSGKPSSWSNQRFYIQNCRCGALDPLVRLKDAHTKGLIPDDVYDLTVERFPITVAGINRIEKASGIKFPIAYVEPSLVISSSDPNSYEYGILFARTIPVMFEEKFQVVIQISAPLVAYGLKGTIHAILAHEFLHFLELIRKISKMELLSDEISGNLFENVYSDETRLFEPRVVFKDRTLLNHITKKFPAGFRDYKLEDKAIKFWADRNLPKTNISLDTNTVKLSVESLSKIKLAPAFLSKIEQLQEKSSKIHKKRLY